MNPRFRELPEEKQLRILNAAMEVFAQNDYKKVSTDLIAAKAEVSKGLLFYYFRNKKELYFSVYEYAIETATACGERRAVPNHRLLRAAAPGGVG